VAYLAEVVVVDDQATSLKIASATLSKSGYRVAGFRDAESAWSYLVANPSARLVVSDWQMPGMTGLNLLEKVRNERRGPDTFFLLCTATRDAASVREAITSGADDYVSKPFEASELIARVGAGERRLALDTRVTMIDALAKLADSRDPETGMHLERVRMYCRRLAETAMQRGVYADVLEPRLIMMIDQTSILHDIGKVGTPDAILNKPGKLTEEEFEVMKQHTVIGAGALEAGIEDGNALGFMRIAHDIILNHHERWDGKGYPNGLSGETIPLPARILSIADVYDALRSQRPYKAPMPHDKAVAIVAEGRGTQFDPLLIDVFLELTDEFEQISVEHADRPDDLEAVPPAGVRHRPAA
jgi:putative two-component system response regulator